MQVKLPRISTTDWVKYLGPAIPELPEVTVCMWVKPFEGRDYNVDTPTLFHLYTSQVSLALWLLNGQYKGGASYDYFTFNSDEELVGHQV